MAQPVAANEYYAEYHGHRLPHLEQVYSSIRPCSKQIVWLAGDSSLDNKHWLYEDGDKINSSLPDGLAGESFAVQSAYT